MMPITMTMLAFQYVASQGTDINTGLHLVGYILVHLLSPSGHRTYRLNPYHYRQVVDRIHNTFLRQPYYPTFRSRRQLFSLRSLSHTSFAIANHYLTTARDLSARLPVQGRVSLETRIQEGGRHAMEWSAAGQWVQESIFRAARFHREPASQILLRELDPQRDQLFASSHMMPSPAQRNTDVAEIVQSFADLLTY